MIHSGRPGERFVGLNSGTSMDGIDAAVVDFSAEPARLLAALTRPFEPAVLSLLGRLRQNPVGFPAGELARLDALLGDALAEAALATIRAAGLGLDNVAAIGSHGQTVLHQPDQQPPSSLQIGDPHRIARLTGLVTVADFRRADLAAGGQGAPLAPLLHDALFRANNEARVVINLGGIANLTRLVPDQPLQGFDTGPANCLLDLWFRRNHEGRCDEGGRWASSGQVDPVWLEQLLADPFICRAAPKSTGIEYFSPAWLDARLPAWADQRPADVQATLAEFTAASVANSVLEMETAPRRILLCGGGVHNADLVARLRARLNDTVIESTARHGLDPDYVEAVLFAWLARRRLAGERCDTRSVTGARETVLAGTVVAP